MWIVGTRAALYVLPWRRVSSTFETKRRELGPTNRLRAKQTVWAVHTAAKWLLGEKPCLTQALVARHLLRPYGVETSLHLGAMRSEGGAVEAHAWLERDGVVVIGGDVSPQKYVRFRTGAKTS